MRIPLAFFIATILFGSWGGGYRSVFADGCCQCIEGPEFNPVKEKGDERPMSNVCATTCFHEYGSWDVRKNICMKIVPQPFSPYLTFNEPDWRLDFNYFVSAQPDEVGRYNYRVDYSPSLFQKYMQIVRDAVTDERATKIAKAAIIITVVGLTGIKIGEAILSSGAGGSLALEPYTVLVALYLTAEICEEAGIKVDQSKIPTTEEEVEVETNFPGSQLDAPFLNGSVTIDGQEVEVEYNPVNGKVKVRTLDNSLFRGHTPKTK